MNEDQLHEEAEVPAGSVFGNLPRERPGTRSPRREASAEARARAAGEDSQEPSPPGPDEPPKGDAEIRSVEDLAWAGVAVAAEAATLGVRLASRAIDAMRGTTGRP